MIERNLVELYTKSFKENWDKEAVEDYLSKKCLTYGDYAAEIELLHINKINQSMNLTRNCPWCSGLIRTVLSKLLSKEEVVPMKTVDNLLCSLSRVELRHCF